MEALVFLISAASVVSFIATIGLFAAQTIKGRPFGNGRMQTFRKYVANEPIPK